MKFGTIIVGAGKGERLKSTVPKCLIRIEGVPLIVVSAWAFNEVELIDTISLVVPAGYESEIQTTVETIGLHKVIAVVSGGARRQDSVNNGLEALPSDIDRVLIHDGARSLISTGLIMRVVEALRQHSAVTAAVPVGNTLHRNENGCAVQGVDRSNLWGAQTPQGFDRKLLIEAFKQAEQKNLSVTDEVTLVRDTMDVKARLVMGEASNLKITHPDDLDLFRHHLEERVKQMKNKNKHF